MKLTISNHHRDLVLYTYNWFKRKFNLATDLSLLIRGVVWKDGSYGDCLWYNDTRSARIRYNRTQKITDLPYTLLHELWHLKQFTEYTLIHLVGDMWMWRGRKIETNCVWSPPWEKEARRYERLLGDELLADKKFIAIVSKNSSCLESKCE